MRCSFLVLLLVSSAIAQSIEPTPPIDVKVELKVSLVGTRHEFHMGEIIPLKLAFSSRVKDRYYLNQAEYDRSGRMNYEQFKVTPTDGAEDPLAKYFSSGPFMGGGLTNLEFLTTKPWTIQLNLNEWLRFTKPGEYRLKVSSNRVEIVKPSTTQVTSPVTALSNEVKFKILPRDQSWEKKTYEQAIAALRRASDRDFADQKSAARHALEILRFLGTADAARELANQLGRREAGDFDCYIGLIGSPEQAAARAALEAALANPDRPLGDSVLNALSWLERENKEFDPNRSLQDERTFLETIVHALPNKRGEALGISLYYVLNRALTHAPPLLPKKEIEKLVTQLIPMFDQLAIKEQEALLDYRWRDIKTPAFLPLLKKYAQRNESDFSNAAEADYYNVRRLTTLAVRRWYELDPTGARPMIIKRMGESLSTVGRFWLNILPDKTLPELDEAFANYLTEPGDKDWQVAPLLARYATGAILPQVLKKVDGYNDECGAPNEMLAYILRVDPAAARPRIEKTIAHCARKNSRCLRRTLTEIAKTYYHQMLEEIAVRDLDDVDPLTTADAATMLGEFGSAAAEVPLLRKYESWSKRWNGHAAELNLAALKDIVGGKADQLTLGSALFNALATGQAWLTDETKLQGLAKITSIPINSFEFDRYLKAWSEKPLVLAIDSCAGPFDGRFSARLVQYKFNSIDRLKEKLKQFPAGTEFTLSLPFDETDRQCVAEIREFLAAQKMSVKEKKSEN